MGVLVSRLIQLQVVTVDCLTISDKKGLWLNNIRRVALIGK